ncbi:hypothetical protein FIBSPDRAFT_206538 [Athelia psychrophila]|uniref:Uncharacterized protein n=1 Tax=Athelia psychrophila TaxID=1759441 RepID=A0A166WIS9_9AGAM|nr:hypothetical protein FIBSPDRAFT_206538 [Fibularhizoctonia sp. CBS 109695]
MSHPSLPWSPLDFHPGPVFKKIFVESRTDKPPMVTHGYPIAQQLRWNRIIHQARSDAPWALIYQYAGPWTTLAFILLHRFTAFKNSVPSAGRCALYRWFSSAAIAYIVGFATRRQVYVTIHCRHAVDINLDTWTLSDRPAHAWSPDLMSP